MQKKLSYANWGIIASNSDGVELFTQIAAILDVSSEMPLLAESGGIDREDHKVKNVILILFFSRRYRLEKLRSVLENFETVPLPNVESA